MSLEEVKTLVMALSPEEQVRLIEDISERLEDAFAANELSAAQKAELDRRIRDADANPASLIPLDEVQRRLSKYK